MRCAIALLAIVVSVPTFGQDPLPPDPDTTAPVVVEDQLATSQFLQTLGIGERVKRVGLKIAWNRAVRLSDKTRAEKRVLRSAFNDRNWQDDIVEEIHEGLNEKNIVTFGSADDIKRRGIDTEKLKDFIRFLIQEVLPVILDLIDKFAINDNGSAIHQAFDHAVDAMLPGLRDCIPWERSTIT